jgi:hypothetical protein
MDMAQKTQQPILKMEIIDNFICTQHLVGGGEVWVCLIEFVPSIGLVATSVYHRCECRDWWYAEAINDAIGASCFILDVEVEFLQACGQLLMLLALGYGSK